MSQQTNKINSSIRRAETIIMSDFEPRPKKKVKKETDADYYDKIVGTKSQGTSTT